MKKIKIAVDIGNTNIVIGLYSNNEWLKIYRLSSKKNITYWSLQKKIKKILSLNDFKKCRVKQCCSKFNRRG